MNVLIFQIAPKDLQIESSYKFHEFISRASLPSETIKEFYEKFRRKTTKIILFLPISLQNKEEIIKRFKNSFIIPSIGKYQYKEQKVIEYKGTYDQIVSSIFSIFVNEFLSLENEQNLEEVIVDISRGQNIFVSSISDALRNFLVFTDLYNLDKPREKRIASKLTFTIPVDNPEKLGNTPIEIFETKFEWKTFFSLPIERVSKNDIYNKFPSQFNDIDKNKIKELINASIFFYSSIKNGIVLPLFYVKVPSEEEIKNTIKKIIDCFQRKLENNDYENIENFNYRLYIRVLQSLALLIGVIKLIKKHVNLENKNENNFVSLEEIGNFKRVLEEVGELAASIFLESEIEKQKMISNEMENSKKETGINNQKSAQFGSKERNFFAHAGLEKTMIIKEGNKIKYKDEIIEELKDCLVKGKGEIFSWLVKRFSS